MLKSNYVPTFMVNTVLYVNAPLSRTERKYTLQYLVPVFAWRHVEFDCVGV